jgi:cell wall-associated NlpC family hydrolase
MTTRAEIVAAARSFIGTPFHHLGRLPGVGLDCAGVVICVGRKCGLVPQSFDVPVYARSPDGVSMMRWCREHMHEIPSAEMQPGDAVVFAIERDPQHMGIVGDRRGGGLSLIHTMQRTRNRGQVVEVSLQFHKRRRFVAAFRLPGVE